MIGQWVAGGRRGSCCCLMTVEGELEEAKKEKKNLSE
jgi:hypothetical protein